MTYKEFADIGNQQKKEISELIAEADNYKKIAEKQQSISMERYFEIKRLKEKIESLEDYNQNLLAANTALSNEILETKDKAYKEFAEKLKEEFLNLQYNAKTNRKTVKIEELKEQMDWLLHTVAIETLENLLKEMVGEANKQG